PLICAENGAGANEACRAPTRRFLDEPVGVVPNGTDRSVARDPRKQGRKPHRVVALAGIHRDSGQLSDDIRYRRLTAIVEADEEDGIMQAFGAQSRGRACQAATDRLGEIASHEAEFAVSVRRPALETPRSSRAD